VGTTKCGIVWCSTVVASEAKNFPFIMKMSSNEKRMKKQCKVFSVDKKMQILAKVDAHMGTQVDPAAVLGLSVSMLHTIMSKRPEIERNDAFCGPSFSNEPIGRTGNHPFSMVQVSLCCQCFH